MEAPIDKEALWNKINSDERLVVKRKRKPLWLLFSIIGLIGVVGFFLFQQTNNLDAKQASKHSLDKGVFQQNKVMSDDTELLVNSNTNDEASTKTDLNNSKNRSAQDFGKYRSGVVDEEDNRTPKVNDEAIKSFIGDQNKVGSERRQKVQDSSNERIDHSKVLAQLPDAGLLKKDEQIQREDLNNGLNESIQDLKSLENDLRQKLNAEEIRNGEYHRGSIDKKGDKNLKRLVVENEDVLMVDFIKRIALNQLNYIRELQSPLLSTITPVQNDKPKWAFDIHLGLGKPNMQQTASLDSLGEFNLLGDQLVKNTRTIESYHFGLGIQRVFNNGIYFKLGSELSYFYQVLNLQNQEVEYVKNDPSNDRFYSRTLTETKYDYYHQFKSLQLNALLGKSFQWKRLSFFIAGGLQYNLQFDVEGKYQDLNQKETELKDLGIYSAQLPLAVQGEVGVELPISERVSVYSSFAMNTSVRMVNSNIHFTQNLQSRQLNVGAKLRF